MALLLDAISSLHSTGLFSDEKALEQTNCYLNHVDDIMKSIDNEEQQITLGDL